MSESQIRILGIDPGTNFMGYGIIDCEKDKYNLHVMGTIELHKLKSPHEKLAKIFERVQYLIQTYQPSEMAVESVFYAKNPQSMLKLGRAQGAAIVAAQTESLKTIEYAAKKVKMAITGNGNASKEQVFAMLNHTMNIKMTPKYLDASDALAVAVCHHIQSSRISFTSEYKDWSAFLKANPEKIKK